mmetsp:Transcript_57926/g.161663  ORF Transcript_57926/g.161663 Transcript_57926/m.161663 type:complete len:219 (-) Transcript_57926:112-768(-)
MSYTDTTWIDLAAPKPPCGRGPRQGAFTCSLWPASTAFLAQAGRDRAESHGLCPHCPRASTSLALARHPGVASESLRCFLPTASTTPLALALARSTPGWQRGLVEPPVCLDQAIDAQPLQLRNIARPVVPAFQACQGCLTRARTHWTSFPRAAPRPRRASTRLAMALHRPLGTRPISLPRSRCALTAARPRCAPRAHRTTPPWRLPPSRQSPRLALRR